MVTDTDIAYSQWNALSDTVVTSLVGSFQAAAGKLKQTLNTKRVFVLKPVIFRSFHCHAFYYSFSQRDTQALLQTLPKLLAGGIGSTHDIHVYINLRFSKLQQIFRPRI